MQLKSCAATVYPSEAFAKEGESPELSLIIHPEQEVI